MPRVAFLSSFSFHLKLLLHNFCWSAWRGKVAAASAEHDCPFDSVSLSTRSACQRCPVQVAWVLECCSTPALYCVSSCWSCLAAFVLCCVWVANKRKALALPAGAYNLRFTACHALNLHTLSHTLTHIHIHICLYVCKQLHTHSQLKRSFATAAASAAAAACLMSKLVPGLTRRMRNMPLPSCVGFMNSPALLAEGANNSLRNQRSLNAKLFPVAAAANVAACHTGHTCHGNTH